MKINIIRIGLHEASPDDYTNLHAALSERGFGTTIVGNDKSIYHLPRAMYAFKSHFTTAQNVLKRAKEELEQPGIPSLFFLRNQALMRFGGLALKKSDKSESG